MAQPGCAMEMMPTAAGSKPGFVHNPAFLWRMLRHHRAWPGDPRLTFFGAGRDVDGRA